MPKVDVKNLGLEMATKQGFVVVSKEEVNEMIESGTVLEVSEIKGFTVIVKKIENKTK